jgi:hypothetical protein
MSKGGQVTETFETLVFAVAIVLEKIYRDRDFTSSWLHVKVWVSSVGKIRIFFSVDDKAMPTIIISLCND